MRKTMVLQTSSHGVGSNQKNSKLQDVKNKIEKAHESSSNIQNRTKFSKRSNTATGGQEEGWLKGEASPLLAKICTPLSRNKGNPTPSCIFYLVNL